MTILHTNDLHAHDQSFSDHGQIVGGLPRIGSLIRFLRSRSPNTVVIDAGDTFQGTPYFKYYHGEVEIALLNKAGYDICTIGNHEFDDGPQNLAKQLKEAKFDVLSCNLDASALPELQSLIKPSTIKEFAGQKVAFVGAITPDLESVSLTTGGVKVIGSSANRHPDSSEWMLPIKQEVERLKAEGINKIILVTHCGVELDKQLALALPDVDAIVGGHSHTRLSEPVMVNHGDGTHTIIVQTGCYGRALGKLNLCFDPNGNLLFPETSSRLLDITGHVPEEPTMRAYLRSKSQPVVALQKQIVGYARRDFDNQFRRYPGDSPLGDLLCDALAEAAQPYGATITLTNRGGIRSRLEKGPISMDEVESMLPFDNHLVCATVSGATLLKALEHSVSGNLGSKFFDMHGLKMAYDASRPTGSRILWAEAQDKDGKWQPLNPQASYKIAVNDYNFAGGEGYDFKGATAVKTSPERLSDLFAAYLQHHHNVTPQEPSRIFAAGHNHLAGKAK